MVFLPFFGVGFPYQSRLQKRNKKTCTLLLPCTLLLTRLQKRKKQIMYPNSNREDLEKLAWSISRLGKWNWWNPHPKTSTLAHAQAVDAEKGRPHGIGAIREQGARPPRGGRVLSGWWPIQGHLEVPMDHPWKVLLTGAGYLVSG